MLSNGHLHVNRQDDFEIVGNLIQGNLLFFCYTMVE